MDFKVQLKKYQEQVNNELEKYSGKKDVPEKILNNSMEYSLMAGGKRLRPILVIATYEIFGKNINKCIPTEQYSEFQKVLFRQASKNIGSSLSNGLIDQAINSMDTYK